MSTLAVDMRRRPHGRGNVGRVDFTYNSAGQLKTDARYSDLGGVNLVASTVYTYNADLGWLTSLVRDQRHGPRDDRLRLHLRRRRRDRHDQLVRGWAVRLRFRRPGSVHRRELHRRRPDGGRTLPVRCQRQPQVVHRRWPTKTYTTGQYNRLETVDDGATITVFGYDARGQHGPQFHRPDKSRSLTTGDTQITEYTSDHRNRLVSVTDYTTFAGSTSPRVRSSNTPTTSSTASLFARSTANRDLHLRRRQPRDRLILAEFGAGEAPTPLGPDPRHRSRRDPFAVGRGRRADHRYLWGEAVDQILADETMGDGSLDDVRWLFGRHRNTVRDFVAYDAQDGSKVGNHIVYGAFRPRRQRNQRSLPL